MFRIEFEIPGLPKTLNSRRHWRATYADNKRWKDAVFFAVAYKRPPFPLKQAHLTLTRFSSVAIDADNLVSGFKPIIDALVDCGVLEDDKWRNIGMPDYRWEKCKPKSGKIKVEVLSVMPPEKDVEGSERAFVPIPRGWLKVKKKDLV